MTAFVAGDLVWVRDDAQLGDFGRWCDTRGRIGVVRYMVVTPLLSEDKMWVSFGTPDRIGEYASFAHRIVDLKRVAEDEVASAPQHLQQLQAVARQDVLDVEFIENYRAATHRAAIHREANREAANREAANREATSE